MMSDATKTITVANAQHQARKLLFAAMDEVEQEYGAEWIDAAWPMVLALANTSQTQNITLFAEVTAELSKELENKRDGRIDSTVTNNAA